MRTNFLKISLCVFLALFIVFSPIAYASNNIEPRQSDVTTTSENSDILASFETNYEIIYSDSYFYDNNVEVSQIIDGNVFAYGQTVNITGVIRGDLFVIADNLTISEEAIIQGNVFALANSTEISGEISDVYAMSSTFSLNNEGLIDRSIYLMANSVSLSGKITRDAYISTQNLSFDKNSTNVIGGNLNYSSNNEIQLEDGIVGGEIKFTKIERQSESASDIVWNVISSIISALVFTLVIILISIWFSPDFKDKAAEIIAKKNLKAFGIGLLVLFGGILASLIVAFFTYGFGMGIGLFLIALIILAYIVSNSIFSISIGSLIAKKLNKENNVSKEKQGKTGIFILFALLVALAIDLIGYIPYIGTPIKFITSIIGLGVLCINAYKRKNIKK